MGRISGTTSSGSAGSSSGATSASEEETPNSAHGSERLSRSASGSAGRGREDCEARTAATGESVTLFEFVGLLAGSTGLLSSR